MFFVCVWMEFFVWMLCGKGELSVPSFFYKYLVIQQHINSKICDPFFVELDMTNWKHLPS